MTTAAECVRKEVVYDLFKVMNLMEKKYASDPAHPGMDIHDMMLADLFPDDRFHNDMYWHTRRNWIKDENARTLFDLICLELGIEQKDEYTLLVFWVSW